MRVPEIDLDLEGRPADRKGRRKPSTAAPKRKLRESKKGTPETWEYRELKRAVLTVQRQFDREFNRAGTGVRYVCEPELIEVPSTRSPLYDGLMEAWTIIALLPDRSGGTKIARAVTKADAECLCRLLNGEKPK